MTGDDSSKLIGFDGQPLLLFWPSSNGRLARLCFTNVAQYQFDHIFIPVTTYLAQESTMITFYHSVEIGERVSIRT